eukprot:scaffold19934_cov50-Attheya_sp.AAC.3
MMKIYPEVLAFLGVSCLSLSGSMATAFVSTALPSMQRSIRSNTLLGDVSSSFLPSIQSLIAAASGVGDNAATAQPVADLPMQRLRLPKASLGREFVIVQLKVKGQGPFDFMVDSGLTTEMITPHLQQTLNIGRKKGAPVMRGLSAGGGGSEALVELEGASLCCGKFPKSNADALNLPLLHAVVTDFPQEHLDPAHDVEGMLGMEVLDRFDADFDFPAGRLRLWQPGTFAAQAAKAGLVRIPAAVLNETRLIGIRITSPGGSKQPLVGVIDCGAAFSVVNWAGAELLGLPSKKNVEAYRNAPSVFGIGIEGKPQQMPTRDVQFTFCGDPFQDENGNVSFDLPSKTWKPWDPVKVGIGDMPVFSELIGDGITPYLGPAAIIGLDVLSQRRVVLEHGEGRARSLYVDPHK